MQSTKNTEYQSFIPIEAQEQVGTMDEHGIRKKEYFLENELVGLRYFHKNGRLASEYAYKHGNRYGAHYTFHPNRILAFVEYYDIFSMDLIMALNDFGQMMNWISIILNISFLEKK